MADENIRSTGADRNKDRDRQMNDRQASDRRADDNDEENRGGGGNENK